MTIVAPAQLATPTVAASRAIGSHDDAAIVWRALSSVVDPEIPIVTVVELGIVRGVEYTDGRWVILITPTYSGCPATRVIEADIAAAVTAATGVAPRVVTALAPAWSTDWIAPEARRKLREFGIAPPHFAGRQPGHRAGAQPDADARLQRVTFRRASAPVRCPNCGSTRTSELARFGSTACKAQYRCADCMEPFDYFKPH